MCDIRVVRFKYVLASIQIEDLWDDVLTLVKTLYDFSVSRNIFSNTEMRQLAAAETEAFSHIFK